jgi:2-iminobutanoate/2-iminopropanoate deaminase
MTNGKWGGLSARIPPLRREPVKTSNAPAALGPYSQAIKVGEFVYTSGHVAIDPATGEFIGGGIAEQTERVLNNVAAVLEAAGSSLDQVVKTLVFLADMNDFSAMNEVYGKFFTGAPPARSTVQAARLPKDALIEIEAVALITE